MSKNYQAGLAMMLMSVGLFGLTNALELNRWFSWVVGILHGYGFYKILNDKKITKQGTEVNK